MSLSISAATVPAAEPLKIAPSAKRQIQVLESIKISKTPAQSKIDTALYLGLLNERHDARLTALPDFRYVRGEADSRVDVDIILSSQVALKKVLQKLETMGAVVTSASARFQRIRARIHLGDLDGLVAMAEVRRIRKASRAYTHAINVSEGDATHDGPVARGIYGVDGSGVTIGVISDGVDSLASVQGSGDLPAVTVLAGQAGGGDEGTAMLEIVHDLAPGATLHFATGATDEASFAQNILDLATAGCDIIVDDLIYLDESPFQDGPVAQAVNTVTGAGVLYFSSAGNEGNQTDGTSGTWEGDFAPNGTPAALTGAGPVHNFGDGGQSILVDFGALSDTPVILTWAEHYDLATGLASTDYDLYDMDGALTTIFDASADTQDGAGGDDFPIEFIGGGTLAGERLVIAKFSPGTTSSSPMFNLILFRGELDAALATNGATRGHSAAASAFSVAATPAAVSFDGTPDGPYPGLFTSANESESFSSDGPRRLILTSAGAEVTPGNRTSTGGVVRQKPDITAADGVSTASPGFSTFYGTSAAAPHAAAIAALIMEGVPGITQAQVRTALVTSAIDIETPGSDRDTGAGIVMASAALQAAGAVPNAHLAAGSAVPTQVMGDGDAFVESNEVWNLAVPLTNDGAVGATAITGVLTTSTPGVVINVNTAAYPDLAVSGSASNLTPFTFTVGSSVPCGARIEFLLTASYTGSSASSQDFPFTITNGSPGTPVTVSYTGPPVPIPDSGGADTPGVPADATLLVVGVPGNVYDVDLRIDGTSCSTTAGSTTVGIDHTFANDLQITLTSPTGASSLVINRTDGGGNNFCQTVLDDESAGPSIQSVVSANAPFTGTFTPNVPLSALDGAVADGIWSLRAVDYYVGDTGNIRAWSLVITPAICDAPALTTNVTGTKTVSGDFTPGGTITYTVTLTNTGGLAQADNPGSEFTDVLPASLTIVSAASSSGTVLVTGGTNTVTWNGPLASLNGSTTITITATINAPVADGTIISNQGTIAYDADGNGTNESAGLTDDPSAGGAADPTNFVVNAEDVAGTKTVSGTFAPGQVVTYTVILSNTGSLATTDNAGNEFTDVLPADLTLVSASATAGVAVATVGTNTVTWNGAIPAAGSVTITINATINNGTVGNTVSNQGSMAYGNGSNYSAELTDDPGQPGASDPTDFVIGAALVTATKTVAGNFQGGGSITYTIVLSNSGSADADDNAGNEFTDILPAALQLVSANATSGTASSNTFTNTVTWNGTVPAGGSVTIMIQATLRQGFEGQTISNQGTVMYDADLDGTNETTTVTDDPSTGAAGDATAFASLTAVPTLSTWAFIMLAVALAFVAVKGRM